jgi:DUF1009 family protein
MVKKTNAIGLIAGGGQFPLMLAESAKKQGLKMVAVAHIGETDPRLSNLVDRIEWIKLGKLGRLIKVFKKEGVKKALMAGTITKRRMFEDFKPDLRGAAMLTKLAVFHDDGLLRAVARELENEGIRMVKSSTYLPDLVAPMGCLTKRKPSREEREDIRFGWRVAKAMGRLDTGQCVVVRKKVVVALEGIDGTDETILRGGRLAKEKAVVVKVSKPGQDLRFDIPTVGLKTMKVMSKAKASVLAIESGKTLIFDKQKMVKFADKAGICIISQ